jgi:hypothetical protein
VVKQYPYTIDVEGNGAYTLRHNDREIPVPSKAALKELYQLLSHVLLEVA